MREREKGWSKDGQSNNTTSFNLCNMNCLKWAQQNMDKTVCIVLSWGECHHTRKAIIWTTTHTHTHSNTFIVYNFLVVLETQSAAKYRWLRNGLQSRACNPGTKSLFRHSFLKKSPETGSQFWEYKYLRNTVTLTNLSREFLGLKKKKYV